jgi:DNA-binding NtrC family response regulator
MAEAAARLLGRSPAMVAVRALVDVAAATGDSVLIRGETGTGKGLVARLIHTTSMGAAAPFVTLSCPALPSASTSFDDLLAAAGGGSLLLDEVGDMPLGDQDAFLSALQRRGQAHRRHVRCLATTRADVDALSRRGRFRPELHAALSVVRVDLPPLRTHLADLPDLVHAFLQRAQTRGLVPAGRRLTLTPLALAELTAHAWLGNVLELENVLERVVVASAGDAVDHDAIRNALARDPARAYAP